ncbi:MAG TPA: DUF4038 domain-containing protein [Mycobacteriales bacterium]|nr:DUF4038 domain-containing protein [Mycobacteriales bacterium]
MELPPSVFEFSADLAGSSEPPHARRVDCQVVHVESGAEQRIPCFWTGGTTWTARIRAAESGGYRCSIADQMQEIEVSVGPAGSWAPELRREAGRRYLRTREGEPFFWMADTWWYGLSERIGFPAEFDEFLAKRRDQGFTVVQIVAGLYPEVEAFDRLGETGGRWPWLSGFTGLDPEWWAAADERILAVAQAGIVPAVVGAWSYYLQDMGDELITDHWRQIVARWAALPVLWCVTGEGGLPHYSELSSPDLQQRVDDLRFRWRAIAQQVRDWDPYDRPMTVHPCPAFAHYSSTDVFGDRELLDLIWLQTGHSDQSSVPPSLDACDREVAAEPVRPVVNSEVCYEGIAGGSAAPLQRFLFWSHVLSGAAGHTYGAQGLWAFRNAEDPGPGHAWGGASWREAAVLPGAAQVGAGARILRSLPWAGLRPEPESVTPHADPDDRFGPYAAGSDVLRVVYFPPTSMRPLGTAAADYREVTLHGLAGAGWDVRVMDPRTGAEVERHRIEPGNDSWQLPRVERATALPTMEDWVLVCERR